jgi:Flp pilus assembly protein TadD
MRYFTWARNQVKSQFTRFVAACSLPSLARLLPATLACVAMTGGAAFGQDTGSMEKEFRGSGAEISVTVHDGAGEPISSPAIVRLYREGSILSGQGATSHGSMAFIVTSLGEFTVVVQAAGYPTAQKDISVPVEGKTQVDVYLHESSAGTIVGVPGKAILAPKAQDAFDRGLRALGAAKLQEAEKFVGEAVRLAPGHPDVLYVQGVLYLKQRDFAQAQSSLEKATQVDPNHARAFGALGMALSDQGKYEAAIAPLEKSLQLDSSLGFETHWALARAYYQSARYADALKSSQLALGQSKGKTPEIALLVAQALTAVGRYEDAAQVLRGYLNEYGDRPEAVKARRWLAGLHASGKIARE